MKIKLLNSLGYISGGKKLKKGMVLVTIPTPDNEKDGCWVLGERPIRLHCSEFKIID